MGQRLEKSPPETEGERLMPETLFSEVVLVEIRYITVCVTENVTTRRVVVYLSKC